MVNIKMVQNFVNISVILIAIGLMNTASGQVEEQERSPPGALGHIKRYKI